MEDTGGWTNRDTSERFAEYAGIVYEALSDSVSLWLTLNEPWVVAWMGHGSGVHAPGKTDAAAALATTHHLLLGHGLAMEKMRSAGDGNQLGVTLNLHPARPSRNIEADVKAARLVDGQAIRLYLDPLFTRVPRGRAIALPGARRGPLLRQRWRPAEDRRSPGFSRDQLLLPATPSGTLRRRDHRTCHSPTLMHVPSCPTTRRRPRWAGPSTRKG
jgi:hypothetical protein